jgi:hypothetical protein
MQQNEDLLFRGNKVVAPEASTVGEAGIRMR